MGLIFGIINQSTLQIVLEATPYVAEVSTTDLVKGDTISYSLQK